MVTIVLCAACREKCQRGEVIFEIRDKYSKFQKSSSKGWCRQFLFDPQLWEDKCIFITACFWNLFLKQILNWTGSVCLICSTPLAIQFLSFFSVDGKGQKHWSPVRCSSLKTITSQKSCLTIQFSCNSCQLSFGSKNGLKMFRWWSKSCCWQYTYDHVRDKALVYSLPFQSFILTRWITSHHAQCITQCSAVSTGSWTYLNAK